MAEGTTDRRVRRTRQLLREALLDLTLERGYDRITVQDILDRADVGRSTFYAHYRDKDDLLATEFEALHPSWNVSSGTAGENPPTEFLEPLRGAFQQAETYRRSYKAMLGQQGAEQIRRLLPQPLSNLVKGHILASYPAWGGDDRRLTAGVQFIVSAFIGMLTWWLDTDAPYSADEMFVMFRKMTVDGATSFFGGSPSDPAEPLSS